MARDFESFIVDPSLLDPSIDATNLRTTTDTRQELLSDVPEFQGIQFDPTRTSYLDDLYALYSGQLPMTPVPTVTPSNINIPLPGGGGGGGGGSISNTVGTPITTDLTDEQINEFAMPTDTGGITSDPIEMENISSNPYDIPMDVDDPGASIENLIAQNPSGTIGGAVDVFDINKVGDPSQNPGSINVGDQPMAAGPFDYLQNNSISTIANPEIFDSYGASVNDPQIGDPGFTGYTPSTSITPETENVLSQAFRTGKEALDSGMQTISQVGQSIADSIKGTYDDLEGKVDVPGLGEISVRDTLAGLAVNTLVGAPVSFVKYAMDQIPPSASQLAYDAYTPEQQAAVDEAFGPGGVMEGYNAVSAFGTTPEQTIQDRIDSIKNRTAPQTEASKNNIKDLEKAKNKITGEAITADDAFKETGDYDGPSVETGPVGSQFEDQSYADPGVDAEENQPDGANESSGSSSSTPDASSAPSRGGGQDMGGAEASGSSSPGSQANSPGNPANQGAPSSASPSNPYGGGEGGVQSGLDSPDVGETSSDAGFEDQSYSGPPSQSSGGGGGGGGGGKIVCTMMNNSYGFGSFRNKIWLKHSKNMAPEYQIGYHKIFLPLIKIAKTNKVVKKVLEHIAVHRTIDIRQESRGKTHLLGRVYRKILEPICYLVGKYAK